MTTIVTAFVMPVTKEQACHALRRSLAYILFLLVGAVVFMALEGRGTSERSDSLAFLDGKSFANQRYCSAC